MTDLTTLANLKAYANITNTTSDALLSRMITAASAFVCNYCNRPNLLSASYTDVYDGNGKDWMLLRQWPVTAVAKVEYMGAPSNLAAADTTNWPPTSGFAVEPANGDSGQQRLVLFGGLCFPNARGAVRVTYTAGYASVPADLEQATIEIVAEDYVRKSRLGIVSQSVGGIETVTYSQKSVSSRIIDSLINFKRVTPV